MYFAVRTKESTWPQAAKTATSSEPAFSAEVLREPDFGPQESETGREHLLQIAFKPPDRRIFTPLYTLFACRRLRLPKCGPRFHEAGP